MVGSREIGSKEETERRQRGGREETERKQRGDREGAKMEQIWSKEGAKWRWRRGGEGLEKRKKGVCITTLNCERKTEIGGNRVCAQTTLIN